MNLAHRIRRARKHAGLSQSEVARALRVHRSCVGHWEGVHNTTPGHTHLAELAKLLVVSYEWLATGRGTMGLGHDPSHDIPAAYGRLIDDSEALRLLRAWDLISTRSRESLLQIAEQLALSRKPRLAREQDLVKREDGMFDAQSGKRLADV